MTKDQMLQDFDELLQFLDDFAVHKDINQLRLGIDYDVAFKNLRKQISKKTSICEFKEILTKATNLVQDLHCSFPKYSYLEMYGKYQKKLNFNDDEVYAKVKAIEEACPKEDANLKLPLLYSQGNYQFYTDVVYKNDTIKKGSKIVSYNGKDISSHIKTNYDNVWPIRWNATLKEPYHKDFYKFGNNTFKLEIEQNDMTKNIQLSLKDSIKYITKPLREIGYFSQPKEQVILFEKQNALYIGLPFMDEGQAQNIITKIDSVSNIQNQFDKILIDVRGNPGGSDMAWRLVLSQIIPKNIPFNRDYVFKYNKVALKFYADDSIDVKEKPLPILNNAKYWSREFNVNSLKPNKNSINHTGKIYILQDKYIYSSTGNLSNFCLNSDQLVSIGVSNDFIGGAQTDPLFNKLSNSGLVLRVEPMLDNSNVKELSDFYHNDVEVKVPLTYTDYYDKVSFNGNIYSKEFLLNHDSLIKYILNEH
ncbi:MAG: hypothetical protein KDC81_00475 [Flavobacteriaceae bacterium]|nr:hypothetical protein [Flavobacteriaceae bacterium]